MPKPTPRMPEESYKKLLNALSEYHAAGNFNRDEVADLMVTVEYDYHEDYPNAR